jgi:hypothetical protein
LILGIGSIGSLTIKASLPVQDYSVPAALVAVAFQKSLLMPFS